MNRVFSKPICVFPNLMIAVGLMAILGTGGNNITSAVSMVWVDHSIHMTRGEVLAVREVGYISTPVLIGCLLSGVWAWAGAGSGVTIHLETTTNCDIVMNFRNADIRQVIPIIGELTGKIFLVDPRVRGTVTLVATTPMCVDDAYQVFLSALTLQGLTVVSQGPIHKVLPARKAKTKAVPYQE